MDGGECYTRLHPCECSMTERYPPREQIDKKTGLRMMKREESQEGKEHYYKRTITLELKCCRNDGDKVIDSFLETVIAWYKKVRACPSANLSLLPPQPFSFVSSGVGAASGQQPVSVYARDPVAVEESGWGGDEPTPPAIPVLRAWAGAVPHLHDAVQAVRPRTRRQESRT
jgi:hypothetical protein